MHLSLVALDSPVIKGEILAYFQDLIKAINKNHSLVKHYFYSGKESDLQPHRIQSAGFVN